MITQPESDPVERTQRRAGDVLQGRRLILLMGVNGAGKTTLAKLLGKTLDAYVDGEEIAFDRSLAISVDKRSQELHEKIVMHCYKVALTYLTRPEAVIVVDRFYETYVSESGISPKHIVRIEDYLQQLQYKALWLNLVIRDDLDTMTRRLEHTRGNRPASWWDPSRGTLEERAAYDLRCQDVNRLMKYTSRFPYAEIDTTDMDWERVKHEALAAISSSLPGSAKFSRA